MNKSVFGLFAFFIFTACVGGPAAKEYPTRFIDQPYVLPQGMKALDFGASYSVLDEDYDGKDETLGPLLRWRAGIGKNFEMPAYPLPLIFKYQFGHNENSTSGIMFGSGIGYSSYRKWIFSPELTVYYRHKLSSKFAWYISPSHHRTFYVDGETSEEVRTAVETGPLFQITDKQVVGVFVDPRWTRYNVEIPDLIVFNDPTYSFATRFALPIGIQYGIRTSQQWELNLKYSYTGIYSDNHNHNFSHYGSILATNYW